MVARSVACPLRIGRALSVINDKIFDRQNSILVFCCSFAQKLCLWLVPSSQINEQSNSLYRRSSLSQNRLNPETIPSYFNDTIIMHGIINTSRKLLLQRYIIKRLLTVYRKIFGTRSYGGDALASSCILRHMNSCRIFYDIQSITYNSSLHAGISENILYTAPMKRDGRHQILLVLFFLQKAREAFFQDPYMNSALNNYC